MVNKVANLVLAGSFVAGAGMLGHGGYKLYDKGVLNPTPTVATQQDGQPAKPAQGAEMSDAIEAAAGGGALALAARELLRRKNQSLAMSGIE